MQSIIYLAALASLAAAAYTPPTKATWGPLLKPDLQTPVTQGETFEIVWDADGKPTDGVTVSLVLCHGDSSNCVPSDTAIVEGVPASKKSYSWSVPSDLEPGKQATKTGYGILVIVDGTGEFQYSTQFSVLEGKSGSGSKPTGSDKDDDKASTTIDGITLPNPTYVDGYNGEEKDDDSKNGTSTHQGSHDGDKFTTTTFADPEPTATKPTKPVKESTTIAVQSTTAAATNEAAEETDAARPSVTPAVQTELSGASRNAAGALFLGALAAAFML